MNKIKDKTLLLLSSTGAAAFIFMSLVEYKPNRIAKGTKYSSFDILGTLAVIILTLWIILIILSLYDKRYKNLTVFTITCILLVLLFWSLQRNTGQYIGGDTSGRISLSAGFYIQILPIYLLLSTYGEKIKQYKFVKWSGYLLVSLFLIYFISTGRLNDLSIMKEYSIKKTQFLNNLKIHGILTIGSVITGVLIAVPLGFLAYSKKKLEGKIMVPLSIIETIPSISLFGILLLPLSKIGELSFFDAIGVSGIGWAPAYIALSLYTLLPIGRNTLTGFYSVEEDAIEAAKGMGMSKSQIFRKIELPLAFPVIFTGIRIAFIQTIGGAVLAGLVGGGGMGTFVFLGLGEASPDLILLGVIPIVFFTIIFDYILKGFEKTIRGVIYD